MTRAVQGERRDPNSGKECFLDYSQPDHANFAFSPVQVFVVTPTSVLPHAHSMQAHPQRTLSSMTTDMSFITPSLVFHLQWVVVTLAARVGKGLGGVLRIHHGAVVQTTITTSAPPKVMGHVREVLEGMGIKIQLETEYKYQCIRAKRRKAGSVGGGSGSSAAFTMVGNIKTIITSI
jgi:protein-serine/threonine kinase